MKCSGISLALAVVLFSSCAFNFENDKTEIEPCTLHTETLTTETVQVVRWLDQDNVLKKYENQFVLAGTGTNSRNIDQIQHYGASGELQWSYAYSWNAGLVNKVSYYNAAGALVWFQTFTYDTEGRVIVQAEYNGTSVLQWVRTNSYKDADPASKVVLYAASYDGSLTKDGAIDYFFLPASADWNREVTFGSASNVVVGLPSPAPHPAAAVPVPAPVITPHAKIALTIPASPAAVLIDASLPVTSYRFAYSDGNGNAKTVVSLTPDWYPTKVVRTGDTRLAGNALTVDLAYDTSSPKRIISKTTTYGSTMALKIELEYAGGFPSIITASGASMPLPLTFAFVYDAGNRPSRLSVLSSGTELQYFTYAYTGPDVLLTANAVRTVDPFSFLDSLLAANVIISHYSHLTEPAVLVETFSTQTVTDGLLINVLKPDTSLNGSFNLLRNAGKAVGLSAKNADGLLLWSTEFALPDAAFEAYAAGVGATVSFGRMAETWLPKDAAETNASKTIADNFIYDLLF